MNEFEDFLDRLNALAGRIAREAHKYQLFVNYTYPVGDTDCAAFWFHSLERKLGINCSMISGEFIRNTKTDQYDHVAGEVVKSLVGCV